MISLARFIYRLLPRVLQTFTKEAYYTLCGWRFDDLKCWVTANAQPRISEQFSNQLIDHESYARLNTSRSAGRAPRLAVVSPVPPADTGIVTAHPVVR